MIVRDVSNDRWVQLSDMDPHIDVEAGYLMTVPEGDYDYGYSPYQVNGMLKVNGRFEVHD